MEIPKSMIEAGARALSKLAHRGEWDTFDESWREEHRKHATACLRAAMVGVEVVYASKYDGHNIECDCGVSAPGLILNDGDTLAVIRGGE